MSGRGHAKTRDQIHVDLEDPVPLPTWGRMYLSGISRQDWGSGINRPYSRPDLTGAPAFLVYLVLAMFLGVLLFAIIWFTDVL